MKINPHEADWAWSEVPSDDNGDEHWKYLIIYYYKGKELWSDYTHKEPNDTICYNILLEALKEDCIPGYELKV